MAADLSGKRILVVEDNYHLAAALGEQLTLSGAGVIGPVPDIEEAMAFLRSQRAICGAILDINLGGEMVFPVADELDRLSIPFIFTTGYDPEVVPPQHTDKLVLRKPIEYDAVAKAFLDTSREIAVSGFEAAGCSLD